MKIPRDVLSSRARVTGAIVGLVLFLIAGAPLGIFVGSTGAISVVALASGPLEAGSFLGAVAVILGVFAGIAGALAFCVGGGLHLGYVYDVASGRATEAVAETATPSAALPWGARLGLAAGAVIGVPVAIIFGTYYGGLAGAFLADQILGSARGFSLVAFLLVLAGGAVGALMLGLVTVGICGLLGNLAEVATRASIGLGRLFEQDLYARYLLITRNPGARAGRAIGMRIGALCFLAFGLLMGIHYGQALGVTLSEEMTLIGAAGIKGIFTLATTVIVCVSIGSIQIVVGSAVGALAGYGLSLGTLAYRLQRAAPASGKV